MPRTNLKKHYRTDKSVKRSGDEECEKGDEKGDANLKKGDANLFANRRPLCPGGDLSRTRGRGGALGLGIGPRAAVMIQEKLQLDAFLLLFARRCRPQLLE